MSLESEFLHVVRQYPGEWIKTSDVAHQTGWTGEFETKYATSLAKCVADRLARLGEIEFRHDGHKKPFLVKLK